MLSYELYHGVNNSCLFHAIMCYSQTCRRRSSDVFFSLLLTHCPNKNCYDRTYWKVRFKQLYLALMHIPCVCLLHKALLKGSGSYWYYTDRW